jgi:glycine cleavage system H protein
VNPPDLRYSKEHEWVRTVADGTVLIGITRFAAESLGDVVFIDLPDVGKQLEQFKKLGEIESVKAVSDLFSPVSGQVEERNQAALTNPQLVNDSPYDKGWLLKASLRNRAELDALMSASQYEKFLSSEGNR